MIARGSAERRRATSAVSSSSPWRSLVLSLAALASRADGFSFRAHRPTSRPRAPPSPRRRDAAFVHLVPVRGVDVLGGRGRGRDSVVASPSSSKTRRRSMWDDDDGGESSTNVGPLTTILVVLVLVVFVGSSLAPVLLDGGGGGGGGATASLGDSVVTRQDDANKLKGYSNPTDKLSRSRIQEKLRAVPVFYTVVVDGGDRRVGSSNVYLSYDDAAAAVQERGSSSETVACTTLDQVLYPLILKRGRTRTAPPPEEIRRAEEAIVASEEAESGSATTTTEFRLVPSATALRDYSDQVRDGDVPLFVADRLAFAGRNGAQVPLFLRREDCVTSYARLRESGGSKLPEAPIVRTTTLFTVLDSMERGTRPGVGQLEFYTTEKDLFKASELSPATM